MKAKVNNQKEFYELIKKDFIPNTNTSVKHIASFLLKDDAEKVIYIQNTEIVHFPKALLSYFEDNNIDLEILPVE